MASIDLEITRKPVQQNESPKIAHNLLLMRFLGILMIG